MGKRRDRFDQRALDQKISRSENAPVKYKERARREGRLFKLAKKSTWPYSRVLRDWLAERLGIATSRLTPELATKALEGCGSGSCGGGSCGR